MTDIQLTAETTGRPHADLLVEIDHVVFGYDASRTILNDVSLAFGRGKVTAILGGSGCGKTTLLRLIGGVHAPLQGTIRVDGKVVDANDLEQLFALRRRLGMLFQFGALFTDLSVYENVAFPLREHTDLDETMIRDIVLMKLNAVGLRGAAYLRISEISGGMARRVALARAMALDPEIVIYDEPFVGLDPISLGVILRLVRQMNDALGLTSIVVSHDVEEIAEVADVSYLISEGKVVGKGTPDEMAKNRSAVVRQFMAGLADGPVPFHYPAPDYGEQLLRREQ
jgi:phospholipid/cholesterol/gamma-HCH transport system ATP-binding protein